MRSKAKLSPTSYRCVVPASSPDDFAATVLKWTQKAKENTLEALIQTIQGVNYEIIINWPVESGYSQGQWVARINGGNQSRAGGATLVAVNQLAKRLQLGDSYQLINLSEYGARLEYGFVGQDSLGRVYNQQGKYIVRRAIQRIPVIAKTIIDSLARRA